MGGCVSKSGEAKADPEDSPYESPLKPSKQRKSWRKSKKDKKVKDENGTQKPAEETEAGEAVPEHQHQQGEDEEKVQEAVKVERGSVESIGGSSISSSNQEQRRKKPVPPPRPASRRGSQENLVDAGVPPEVRPRSDKQPSVDHKDPPRPVAAPRDPKSIRKSTERLDDDAAYDHRSDRGSQDSVKAVPSRNAVQVLPPMPGSFALKKSTPVLERQGHVDSQDKPERPAASKPASSPPQTAASLDEPVDAPPELPPKDVNSFLNELDYDIPSNVVGSATKDSPRKPLLPPKGVQPVNTSDVMLQMRGSKPAPPPVSAKPQPPSCKPPPETGLYLVTDVVKNTPPSESRYQKSVTTKTTATKVTTSKWTGDGAPVSKSATTTRTVVQGTTNNNNFNKEVGNKPATASVETTQMLNEVSKKLMDYNRGTSEESDGMNGNHQAETKNLSDKSFDNIMNGIQDTLREVNRSISICEDDVQNGNVEDSDTTDLNVLQQNIDDIAQCEKLEFSATPSVAQKALTNVDAVKILENSRSQSASPYDNVVASSKSADVAKGQLETPQCSGLENSSQEHIVPTSMTVVEKGPPKSSSDENVVVKPKVMEATIAVKTEQNGGQYQTKDSENNVITINKTDNLCSQTRDVDNEISKVSTPPTTVISEVEKVIASTNTKQEIENKPASRELSQSMASSARATHDIKEDKYPVFEEVKTKGHLSFAENISSVSVRRTSSSGSNKHVISYSDSSACSSDSDDEGIPGETSCAELIDLLADYSDISVRMLRQHITCPNTRTKQLAHLRGWIDPTSAPVSPGPTSPGLKLGTASSGVLVLSGAPGMGKTNLAAEMCRRFQDNLIACHFFSHMEYMPDSNAFIPAVESCVRSMVDHIPQMINYLPTVDEYKCLKSGETAKLLNEIIIKPLKRLTLPSGQIKLIVLDGLDWCEDKTELLEFLSTFTVPNWLRVLITVRSHSALLSDMGTDISTMELKKTNDNYVDMKRLLTDAMSEHMDRISLNGGLNQLAKKSEGSYLCGFLLVKLLGEMGSDKKIALREVDSIFPKNLNTLLGRVFNALKSAIGEDRYAVVVSRLCLAREPLDVCCFFDVCKCSTSQQVLEDIAPINILLNIEDNCIAFCSAVISEWVSNDQVAKSCYIDLSACRQRFATSIYNWIRECSSSANPSVRSQYALKHGMYHIVDSTKQSEHILSVLCDLTIIKAKLELKDSKFSSLLKEYTHEHIVAGEDNRIVSVKNHFKGNATSLQMIAMYKQFLESHTLQLASENGSKFLLNIAANYVKSKEIRDTARALLDTPWLEDRCLDDSDSPHETYCPGGIIKAIDLSPDNTTLALLCKDEAKLNLHLYNYSAAGSKSVTPSRTPQSRATPDHQVLDVKTLSERVGTVITFLPGYDGIFVGSLTTLVSTTQCKGMSSGFDIRSLHLKDRFSIECCAANPRYLICGLSTLPWGGKTLHLCMYDLRIKRCMKTADISPFRNAGGGGALASVVGCGIAAERPLVCACVRESKNKTKMRVTIWNTTKWQVVNSLDMSDYLMSKCIFLEQDNLLLGTGLSASPLPSRIWTFGDPTNKTTRPADDCERCCVLTPGCWCRWTDGPSAVIRCWQDKGYSLYKLEGLNKADDVAANKNAIACVEGGKVRLYTKVNLLNIQQERDLSLFSVKIRCVTFVPKSDTALIMRVYSDDTNEGSTLCDVYAVDTKSKELALHITPFVKQPFKENKSNAYFKHHSSLCQSTFDGNFIILNTGVDVLVWNRMNDEVSSLKSDHSDVLHTAVSSTRDYTVSVVYSDLPHTVVQYDLKMGTERLLESTEQTTIVDLVSMPANGMMLAYQQRDLSGYMTVWGAAKQNYSMISSQQLKLSYAKASPASDRIALSIGCGKRGKLILRNSDGSYGKQLNIRWLSAQGKSDIGFSPDGTIMIAVCKDYGVAAIYSAGNAELLQNLSLESWTAPDGVIGMLTNTHLMLYRHDGTALAVDVGSCQVMAIVNCHAQDTQLSVKSWSLSPSGAIVLGTRQNDTLLAIQCHGFETIKRRTTLQRMKAYSTSTISYA